MLRPYIRHQQMGPVTLSRLVALEHCIKAKVGTLCLYPVSGSSSPIKHSHIQQSGVGYSVTYFDRIAVFEARGTVCLLIFITNLFFVQDPGMHAFNFTAKEVAFACNSCAG